MKIPLQEVQTIALLLGEEAYPCEVCLGKGVRDRAWGGFSECKGCCGNGYLTGPKTMEAINERQQER